MTKQEKADKPMRGRQGHFIVDEFTPGLIDDDRATTELHLRTVLSRYLGKPFDPAMKSEMELLTKVLRGPGDLFTVDADELVDCSVDIQGEITRRRAAEIAAQPIRRPLGEILEEYRRKDLDALQGRRGH